MTWVCSHAPFAVILVIFASDLCVMFGPYNSPFRHPSGNGEGIWTMLSNGHTWQFLIVDLICLALSVPTLKLARSAWAFNQATLASLHSYESELEPVFVCQAEADTREMLALGTA